MAEAQLQEPGVVDGSSIKELVQDPRAFHTFVDDKFRALDRDKTGELTPSELQPAVLGIGSALGLPPKGSSPDTDPIYDQVLRSFVDKGREKVTKEKFSLALRDILLGLADGLEREPIKVMSLDGQRLEQYAKEADAEFTAVNTFVDADTGGNGKAKASLLRAALGKLSALQGAPPPGEGSKPIIDAALKRCGVDEQALIDQIQFVELFKKAILEMARSLKEKPITVAHIEKTFDGQGVKHFLSDKNLVNKEIGEVWDSLPKDKHGKMTKENLIIGLDALAPKVGLPPLGAVEEMDAVVRSALGMINPGSNDVKHHHHQQEQLLDKSSFEQYMRQVLGGLMLQLEGKPIVVCTSSVVNQAQAGNPAAIF